MRVMGVDPGLARCGVAVVDGDSRRSTLAAQRLIRTASDDSSEQRLAVVHDQVADMITNLRPEALAIERLLFNANAHSAMAVAQAVGVILLAAAHADLTVEHYTPTQVKAAVTGQGDADKAQVKYLVRSQLQLRQTPRSADVADAAAVALCHLWRAGRSSAADPGGYSPRLAAAIAAAGPGAQVVRPAGGDDGVRASASEPAGGDDGVRASASEPAGGETM